MIGVASFLSCGLPLAASLTPAHSPHPRPRPTHLKDRPLPMTWMVDPGGVAAGRTVRSTAQCKPHGIR